MALVEADLENTAKGRNHLDGMRADQRTALVFAVYLATQKPNDNFAKDIPEIVVALNNGLVNTFTRASEIEHVIGSYIVAHPKASYEETCEYFFARRR